MSKNTKVSIIIFIFLSVILNHKISYGYKNLDLFSCILDESKGCVEECGVKTHFKTYKNGQELHNDFITQISKEYKNYSEKISRDKGNIIIRFQDEHSEGHIEFNNDSEEKNVSLQIIQKNHQNNTQDLKDKIEKLTSHMTKEKTLWWIYLKAKLNDKDNISCINEKIVNHLESEGITALSTIKIQNGYSSSAYTGKYKPIKNGDKLIDFNFAVCKYSSGNYIIIGTPEIFVPY
ncbi:YwmB family TATA-box binding protein [Clostridium sp. MB40-C1]|uniref:YwmB family TATA-box binding protein n=1 Tax=Clostridium sp. MB40-C1 TaxID=3070996 RepID=UPI0027E0AC64|nr:YwmB family TATA-box binding protein [Clostridium sp. MB40-C1]WMJ79667.1 YwmB family TATA-box binding protein [Clostridium sp. MB40-C1]